MRGTDPPSVATWMLEHLVPGPRNDALAGDLLEEFRQGRVNGWYWRQVMAVIVIGFSRELRNHATVMLFAAAWSMLAPAWLLIISNFEMHFNLDERLARMDWPWPIVCDVGLLLAANVLFIWAGIVLYLIPRLHAEGILRFRLLAKGLLASLPVLLALWATLVVLPKIFLEQSIDRPAFIPATTGQFEHPSPNSSAQMKGLAVERHPATSLREHLIEHPPPSDAERIRQHEEWLAAQRATATDHGNSPRSAIIDPRTKAIVVSLPFFLTILCALWGAALRFDRRQTRLPA